MFYTAIIMGLAGSLHCAGMCSPLAMAVTRSKPFLISSLVYNIGRILVYAALGAVASSIGSIVHLAPYQQVVSMALGISFLLVGLGFFSVRIPIIEGVIIRFTAYLKKMFGQVLQKKSWATTFLLGTINGLLPCGLTYLALSACLILPTAMNGFSFMFFFGLGTWPVMVGFTRLLNITVKNYFSLSRFSKIAMIFIGCVLLLRVWWVHPHSNNLLMESPQASTVCK